MSFYITYSTTTEYLYRYVLYSMFMHSIVYLYINIYHCIINNLIYKHTCIITIYDIKYTYTFIKIALNSII